MAIQLRRGAYEDFDPDKMIAAEVAVVTSGDPDSRSGRALYICFEPGVVKRIVDYEDILDLFEDAEEEAIEAAVTAAVAALQSQISSTVTHVEDIQTDVTAKASTATTKATEAAASASTATTKASEASSSASTATTKATEAASSASTATSKASEAATSAAQAAASAALIEPEKTLGDFASYQTTTTASKAYKVGEFLTYNGYLYRVTTAIASGGTITPGTNCVQTNVGDEVANSCLRFDSVAVSATTGDIATITDSRITANHIVAECVWGDPSAITSDVTVTTSAGSAVLNGTCGTATTVTLTLIKKQN